ncbi:MAG TPA: ArsA family ATPase, partial [Nitriliruptorales bacterium]|nr:ArsA family ATPase [Nitriliruptorales bacterium]
MARVLLFTGKGGVGKTTVAAATAARAASDGARVLVTSTDPAHSLADVFDLPLGDAPTPVAPNLAAQQIDPQLRLEEHWREVRDYLVELLAWGGLAEVQAEELALLPGLDELFSLVDLRSRIEARDHDLIVVDCAPTAETLRFLALPDAVRWYVERVVVPGRHIARAVRPVATRVSTLPIPEDRVFGAVQRLHRDLGAVHALLQDPGVTSVRLVINPERVVISEALRTATSLSLFGYALDAVVVNRLLPDAVSDPYLARWKARHAEHLTTVRHSFAPTPVLTARLFDDELQGLTALHRLAASIYGDMDVAAVLHHSRPVHLRRDGDDYRLSIALPFASKDDLQLHRRGHELHVKVAGVKRTVPLPAAVRRHEVAGAR